MNKEEFSLFEQINLDLEIFGDVTLGDRKHRLLIIKTLAALPEDVREKVLDEVTFIMLGEDTQGHHFSMNVFERDKLEIILLNFCAMINYTEKKQKTVIGHEIAHYILGTSGGKTAEIKADDLCEKWGLGRAYKSYEQFPDIG